MRTRSALVQSTYPVFWFVELSRPTGDVVTVDCVEKIIKKDMLHPLTGIALKEKDIIYLQRGGTGYAATNEKLKASHYRPNLAIA